MPDQLQPIQPSLIRLVGVDAPQMNFPQGAKPMSEAPQVQDTAFARIQDAQKAVDSMFDIQRGNLQSQANLQQTYAQTSAAKGKPQWVQDFANLGDTIMQGVQIVKAQDAAIAQAEAQRAAELAKAATVEQQKVIEERQAKEKAAREQYEAELKKNQSSVASIATARIENLVFDMGRIIREQGEQTGVLQTKREIDDYLASIKDQVDPDTLQALTKHAYTELRKVDGTLTERNYEQSKQLRTALGDQQLAVYRNRAGSIFATLEVAQTPQELDSAMTQLNSMFAAISQDTSLTAAERLDIQTNLLNEASNRKLTNTVAQTKLTQSIEANREYATAFAQWNQLRDEGKVDENTYRTAINELNLTFGGRLPGLSRAQLLTSDEQQKMALDLLNVNNGLEEAARKAANREALASLANIDKLTVGISAYQILESPHLRTQIEAGDNIELKQALELADRFTTEAKTVQGYQSEKLKLMTTMASLAGKIDPSRRGQQREYDALTGAFVAVEGIPTSSATPEEYATLENRMRMLDQEIAKSTQFWSSYGLNALDPRDKSFLKSREEIQAQQQSLQTATGLVPATTTPAPSPFNRVAGNGSPALPPATNLKRYQINGRTITLPITPNVSAGITSGYGMRMHPIRKTMRFHSGVDIPAPMGTPIHTVAGGRVVYAGNTNPQGFGITVVVETPNGHYEQYSHNSNNLVRVGDQVRPGQVVAKTGSTGGSTGAHIHMTVWKPGQFVQTLEANQQNTIDPVQYMAGKFAQPTGNNGVGAPARTPTAAGGTTTGRLPPGLHPLVIQGLRKAGIDPNNIEISQPINSSYTVDPYTGVGAPSASVSGGRAPNYARKGMSVNRADYPAKNDPEANYGYSALANDAPFRRKIAEVADYLGMPAVWLVDVMHFESAGFRPDIVNGIGATGLIQFMPETAIGLGTTTAQLSRMSRVQQMEYVKKYFDEIRGKIQSPGDTLAFIFGGGGLFRRSEASRNPIGDGHITYGAYKRRLGNAVGRSYAFPI